MIFLDRPFWPRVGERTLGYSGPNPGPVLETALSWSDWELDTLGLRVPPKIANGENARHLRGPRLFLVLYLGAEQG